MKHIPPVLAFMTPFPHAIDIGATLGEARRLMHEWQIRHVPVIEQGQLAGVLTDRDVKLALGPDLDYPSERELCVRDVCIRDAYTVDGHTPLDQVAEMMADRRIGSALVTHHGRLAGVFTSRDACRALAQVLRERFPPPRPGTEAA